MSGRPPDAVFEARLTAIECQLAQLAARVAALEQLLARTRRSVSGPAVLRGA